MVLSSRERNSCNWQDVEFMLRSVALCTFCKFSDAKLYPFWLFTQVELPAAEIAATIDAFCTKHLSELSKVHTPLTSFFISPWLILTTVSLGAKFFGTKKNFVSCVLQLCCRRGLYNGAWELIPLLTWTRKTLPLCNVCSCQRQVEHH